MNKWEKSNNRILGIIVLVAVILFGALYFNNLTPKEEGIKTQNTSLDEWNIDNSAMNGTPIKEDKSIYSSGPNVNIHDVYISVFPTKTKEGEIIDFSAFGMHSSRDHSYNPELNCNVQILKEGETLDPLTGIDSKNAIIRVRGNSSRGDTYKSYKVKLDDEGESFFGQRNLNINKHSEDITKIATKLQTDILTSVPNIISYRTYFMRVWIRDTSLPKDKQEFKYYGFFTEIEQPNKTYLEARGLSSNASLYKARDFSFQISEVLKDVDDPNYNEEGFETVLTIREANSHKKLLELLEAVNDESRDFKEVFNKYFNEDNYLTWLAFNLLMGNNDIINHNFIIYNPDNSNTWYFVPWDFDGTLRFGEHESILMKLPPSLKGIQKLNQSVLHRRYFRLEGSIEKIKDKMDKLLEDYVTEEKVTGLVNSYKPVLEKTITQQPDIGLLDEMNPKEYSQYLDKLYDGILSNYEAFNEAIKYPSPMYVAQPKQDGDSVVLSWESAYSYQGLPVTYNVQIFTDYNMKNKVQEEKNIAETKYTLNSNLSPGTYYLRVTAVDNKGHEQLSMERFETMITDVRGYNVNGVLEIKIE
ncbi:CotH kinase family protein [Clostridium sp.]|uniref:CotH kinase family protein n=1 Tax=Clostridium sp. TaxID=1506 RepID=UPI002FC674E2